MARPPPPMGPWEPNRWRIPGIRIPSVPHSPVGLPSMGGAHRSGLRAARKAGIRKPGTLIQTGPSGCQAVPASATNGDSFKPSSPILAVLLQRRNLPRCLRPLGMHPCLFFSLPRDLAFLHPRENILPSRRRGPLRPGTIPLKLQPPGQWQRKRFCRWARSSRPPISEVPCPALGQPVRTRAELSRPYCKPIPTTPRYLTRWAPVHQLDRRPINVRPTLPPR